MSAYEAVRKARELLVYPHRTEQHTHDHKPHQNAGRRELCLIDQQLRDHAKRATRYESEQKTPYNSHALPSLDSNITRCAMAGIYSPCCTDCGLIIAPVPSHSTRESSPRSMRGKR